MGISKQTNAQKIQIVHNKIHRSMPSIKHLTQYPSQSTQISTLVQSPDTIPTLEATFKTTVIPTLLHECRDGGCKRVYLHSPGFSKKKN